jgi:lysophospholipase L1-like esterase
VPSGATIGRLLAVAVGGFAIAAFVRAPHTALSPTANLVLLTLLYLVGAFALGLGLLAGARGRLGGALAAAAMGCFTLIFVEGVLRTFVEAGVARSPAAARALYRHAFESAPLGRRFFGAALNYEEHPHLNYALSPDAVYGSMRQFQGVLHIRRTEAIRPRSAVRWRAIALGGSTTFGEQVAREEATWVHRLEQRIRERAGPDVDVINGGVGGYTTVENLVHYATLLTHLEPEVVILYLGINDVHPRHHSPHLHVDYSNYWKPWRSAGHVLEPPSALLAWSAAYRLYYFRRHVERVRLDGIWQLTTYAAEGRPEENLARNPPTAFRANLETLVQLVLGQGRRVVILPQYFRSGEGRQAVLAKGVAEHNEVSAQVARKYGVVFGGEILTPSAFGKRDVFDNCHFNEAGSEKMAGVVYGVLERASLLPEPPTQPPR